MHERLQSPEMKYMVKNFEKLDMNNTSKQGNGMNWINKSEIVQASRPSPILRLESRIDCVVL